MKLRPVKRYSIPKYPQGKFTKSEPNQLTSIAGKGALLALIASSIPGCNFIGIPFGAGNLIEPDHFISEADARPIIDSLFANEGVEFEHDFLLVLNDTMKAVLPGYDPEKRIGYWYDNNDYPNNPQDATYFDALNALQDSLQNNGPYVGGIYVGLGNDDAEARRRLVSHTNDFIGTLRSLGVL